MSKNIQLSVTDFQYETLLKSAGNLSIQQYLLKKEFPDHEFSHWFNEILKEVDGLTPNQPFSLKALLPLKWEDISKGVRLSIGRQFLKQVNDGDIQRVKYIGKNSANTAIYQKI